MKRSIIFRVDGYKELGLGHIYNCISLAEILDEHEVLFLTKESCKEGFQKLSCTKWEVRTISELADMKEIYEIIDEVKPDIWVNDCLNTEIEYVEAIKKRVNRFVSIEDLGEGIGKADAVINAMYEEDDRSNVFSGWKYACLRDEFQIKNASEFRDAVKNVIFMFGGTDPSNYNRLLYNITKNISNKYENIKFSFITGYGYDVEKNGLVSIPSKNIYVYSGVSRVSDYMSKADIAITSQGRTIFELAAMGVPAIVLAQNEREQTHTFAQMDHGFLNLGLKDISEELVENTLDWLINTPPIRKNMYDLMQSLPLRDGIYRVKQIVLGEKG